MDINDILDGLSKAEVHNSADILDEKIEDTEDDNVEYVEDDIIHTKSVEVDDEEDVVGETDEDYIKKFATELGYDGEVEGEGLEALLYIAKSKLTVLDNPKVQDIINHVNNGGDVSSYERMQPTDYYQGIELDESDEELTEKAVVACLVNLRNFDDDKEITKYIQNLKDEGELFEYAKKNFPKLQAKEKAENTNKQKVVENELKKERLEEQKFYSDLEKSLNSLNGVVNKSLKEEVKQFSLPDKKGVIEVEAFLNDLQPSDIATMNYFAYCLKNSKEFIYRPDVKGKGTQSKPIHQILNKGIGKNDKSERVLLKDFMANRLK
jgi:hypothetical protein